MSPTDRPLPRLGITEYLTGYSFAYELTGFTNILARVVHGVRGEWTFTPDGVGTLIRWTYEFKPRPLCSRLVRHGLGPLWRHYMRTAITRTVKAAEQLD